MMYAICTCTVEFMTKAVCTVVFWSVCCMHYALHVEQFEGMMYAVYAVCVL